MEGDSGRDGQAMAAFCAGQAGAADEVVQFAAEAEEEGEADLDAAAETEDATDIGQRYAPWVKLVHAGAGLAPQAESLLQSARESGSSRPALAACPGSSAPDAAPDITYTEAIEIYQACLERWRVRERFLQPDWSIVDLWVARHLLSRGYKPEDPPLRSITRVRHC